MGLVLCGKGQRANPSASEDRDDIDLVIVEVSSARQQPTQLPNEMRAYVAIHLKLVDLN
jgi:hypothetical protein